MCRACVGGVSGSDGQLEWDYSGVLEWVGLFPHFIWRMEEKNYELLCIPNCCDTDFLFQGVTVDTGIFCSNNQYDPHQKL